MSDVFNGQSLLTIKLDTETTISSATVTRILYKKPSGTTGYWDATVEGTDVLKYDLQDGDIDESGDWEFQAYVVLGGLKGYGDKVLIPFETTLT